MDSNTQPSQSTLQNTLPDQNPAELTQLQAVFAYQNELIKDFKAKSRHYELQMNISCATFNLAHQPVLIR